MAKTSKKVLQFLATFSDEFPWNNFLALVILIFTQRSLKNE